MKTFSGLILLLACFSINSSSIMSLFIVSSLLCIWNTIAVWEKLCPLRADHESIVWSLSCICDQWLKYYVGSQMSFWIGY